MTAFYICQNKLEWDDYILENGGHPLQLWGWGDVKAANGWQAYRLFGRNADHEIVGAVQVLIKRLPWPLKSIAYVPRGPIVDDTNRGKFLDDMAKYVRKSFKSVAISIEPDEIVYDVPEGWKKSSNRILPAETIVLGLSESESDILSKMAKKTRQYIRKSASEGIEIKKVRTHHELAKCLEIYRETSKRANFKLHEYQYYYDVFDKMGEYSSVFAVYVEGDPIAFLWIITSADTAFELYGGMNSLGQELRANYALKWHVVRKCKEWELLKYDFGGLIDGGVSTFKMGWTDQPTNLVGTYDKPLSKFYGIWEKGLPTAKKVIRKIK